MFCLKHPPGSKLSQRNLRITLLADMRSLAKSVVLHSVEVHLQPNPSCQPASKNTGTIGPCFDTFFKYHEVRWRQQGGGENQEATKHAGWLLVERLCWVTASLVRVCTFSYKKNGVMVSMDVKSVNWTTRNDFLTIGVVGLRKRSAKQQETAQDFLQESLKKLHSLPVLQKKCRCFTHFLLS